MIECSYVGRCGGCPEGHIENSAQAEKKLSAVRALFPDVRFVYSPLAGVRDRADLVWQEGRLGLYGLDSRDVVDLEACPMMTSPLEAFFKEFRQKAPPIKKGSVRLRVSPAGERGVWLDFANQDVKTLFEEKEYLRWLSDLAFVEIGQRRKALVWKEGAPKLVDPILKPWFQTYDASGVAIPLYGPVGGFTQAGFESNRALVEQVSLACDKLDDWVELFCGNGNFTLALAARGKQVEAIEMDELAIEGMKRSLEGKDWPVTVTRADVYLKSKTLPSVDGRGLLVDPPRAGMRETLALIEAGARPAAIAYVSCFTDVFIKDCERLKSCGYNLVSLVGVDQFPQSPHAEWVALLLPSMEIA